MVLEMVRNFPERLSWRLKSTAELHTRIDELERLKDHMQTVGMTITDAVSDGTLIQNRDTYPFPSGNVYS